MNVNPIAHSAPSQGSSAPANTAQAANAAEATFLRMLVTELQSQDPSSPMDTTQMVSQMFSMNQLNELISINATLQAAFGTSGSGTTTGGTTPTTGGH